MDDKMKRDLRIIEAALDRCELTDEQREQLEQTRDSMNSEIGSALRQAVLRGDDEVAIVLAKAYVEKFATPGPPESQCVIYCRVSTEQQTKGHGLTRQLQTCMEYAKAKNYSVVAVFSEVWTGAEPLSVRAQAERMAEARGCKIICEDYDRWSRRGLEDLPPRNVEMASSYVRELEQEMNKLFTSAQLYVINSRFPN